MLSLPPQNLQGSNVKTEHQEAGHFIQYVHQELERLLEGLERKDQLYSGGLKVYTTIDMSMQTVAEKKRLPTTCGRWIVNMANIYPIMMRINGIPTVASIRLTIILQAALIAFEPKTGHIKAMVGGRDYYIGNGDFNFL